MRTILKQVLGIDVAQKELVVCLGHRFSDLNVELLASGQFANSAKGFQALLAWLKRISNSDVPIEFVMEATGVYHERLANFLFDRGCKTSIIMPSKISNYARTLDVKTVTDKTASQAIARFGLDRKLEGWIKPQPTYKKLRQLSRERDQLVQERTMVKNQLHAEQAEAEPNADTLSRTKKRLNLLILQEKQVKTQIAEIIESDPELKKNVARICTIPGIGVITAAVVLSETNGFDLIRNKRQLTSYAGLDIREKQSGTSINGKPRISKRGNKYLRKAMHLPALTAIRRNPRYKAVFARLVSRHRIKMKATVAIQRKLLELTYTIFKNKSTYDQAYPLKNEGQTLESNDYPSQAGTMAALIR